MRAANERPASWRSARRRGTQWRPAIEWLANDQKASRWYLIGSDYVWPWLSHKRDQEIHRGRRRACRRRRVRADRRAQSQQPASARIRAARPDVVLISLIGTDSVVFNRAFGEQRARLRACCGWPARWTRPCCSGSAPTTPKTCSARPAISSTAASRANDAFRGQYRSVVRPPRAAARLDRAVELRRAALPRDGRGARRIAGDGSRCSRRPRTSTIRARAAPSACAAAARRMPIYLAEADGLDFRLIKQF